MTNKHPSPRVREIVDRFTRLLDEYDAGIELEVSLCDWLTTTLSQLEEESANKVLDLLERAGTKNNPLPLMDFSTHGFEKDYISRSLIIKALTTSVTAVDGLNNTCTKHVKYM